MHPLLRRHRPASRLHSLLAVLLAVLCLLWSGAPASAQAPLDVSVTIFSDPSGQERVAIGYDKPVPRSQMEQDFQALASQLNLPVPKLTVSSSAGIWVAEGELRGLTNWTTGTVNLDALIGTFRRYGRFQVMCLFMGNFPLQTVVNERRGPVEVRTQVNGNSIGYEIRVDQSQGVPKSIPSFNRGAAFWPLVIGILGLLAVIGASAYLIVYAIRARREAAPGGRNG